MTPHNRDDRQFARMRRRVAAEQDGTRDGGLVVCIALIGGMIVAAMVNPIALTSFWVWVGILCMAIGCGVSVQRLVVSRARSDEAEI